MRFLKSQGVETEFYLYHRPRKKGKIEMRSEAVLAMGLRKRVTFEAFTLSIDPF